MSASKMLAVVSSLVFTTTVFLGLAVITPSSASAAGSGESSKAEPTQCYRGESVRKATAKKGNTLGTARVIGKWCVKSGKVTSAEYLAGWAETATPFWSVRRIDIPERGEGIVDNKAKVWEKFHLDLLIETQFFSYTQNVMKCPQMVGSSAGKNEGGNRCGIY